MSYNPRCSFSVLPLGSTFDWVNANDRLNDVLQGAIDANGNSFYLRCTKISPRKYRDALGFEHRVGTIKATVYHAWTPNASVSA